MQLTSEQIEYFNSNGYLILDNFYNSTELNDFKEAFRKLIQSSLRKAALKIQPTFDHKDFVGKEFDEGMMKLEKIDHAYIANIYDIIPQIPEFLRLVSKPEISECINQLLKRGSNEPLYSYTPRCRIDPPLDERRTTKWHQEVFYSIPGSEFLQTWAPFLYDATIENGTIEACVSSNKDGIIKQLVDNVKGSATPFVISDNTIQKYTQKSVEMKVGQFMIFSSRLIHRSGSNTSKNIRYSLIGMYHNIDNENFIPPELSFKFRGKSPTEYYNEIFN